MWWRTPSTKRLEFLREISRVEADKVQLAEELLALAKEKGVTFLLPVDAIETDELKAGAQSRNTPAHSSGEGTKGWQAVDIGRETIAQCKVEIGKAKTIRWNGPVGVFEIVDFAMAPENSPKLWRRRARKPSLEARIR